MSDRWMIIANEWASAWAPAVWRATWQGGLFVAAVCLVCRFSKRMSSAAQNWLWWLASLQMLVRLASITPVELPLLPVPTPSSEVPIYTAPKVVPAMVPAATAIEISAHFQSVAAGAAQVLPGTRIHRKEVPSALMIAMGLWLVGVIICFSVSGSRLLGTRRLLKEAQPISSGPASDIVQEYCLDFGIRQPPLLESERALCPLLAGWIRPAIVLPLNMASELTEVQLRMAIAHEFAHLKRRDLWLGIVPAITQSLFFFHPLAWLATHEGAAAREAACDSEAMRIGGGTPAAYARLLLNTAQSRSSMAVLGTAFGYRLIQRRISMLNTITGPNATRYRPTATLMIALGAICVLPWSVTAQALKPAQATHKPAKKLSKAHKGLNSKITPPKSAARKTTHLLAMSGVRVPVLGLRSLAGSPMPPPPGLAPTAAVPPAFSGGGIRTPAAPSPGSPPGGFGLAGGARQAVSLPPRNELVTPPPSPREGFGTVGTPSTPPTLALPSPQAPEDSAVPSRRYHSAPEVCNINADGSTVEFFRVELHKALSEFLKARHANFSISSEVEPDYVTANLSGLSTEGVLRTILKSAKQPLTYEVEDGIYTIKLKSK